LIFRGIAFEFRTVSHSKTAWNIAFSAGSTVATFAQGVVLGGLIQGIKVENNAYAGGPLDWATPFALFCGLALGSGYLLLGATWLVMKTDGVVADRARAHAKIILLVVLAFMAVVSLWTPLAYPRIFERWFSVPNIFYLWPVPVVTLAVAFLLGQSLAKGRDVLPFLATIALFLLGYLGLVISNFPYLVPPSLTVWQTAAAPSSQIFMLIGTLLLLPIVIGYIVFVYWLFRGKVKAGESYEHYGD
jgi:cytochrome d ubiquinol oxidase subunit II